MKKYYSQADILTDLSDYANFTNWLSPDPRVIFQVAQGLIIHSGWIDRYGVKVTDRQIIDRCSPSASDILKQAAKLRAVDISPAQPRSPEQKVVGCCREFALFATALFRAKKIPARARCGFALYLANEGFYEDHWVCEYWDGKRWVKIDPQIDPFQQSVISDYALNHKPIGDNYKKMLLSLDPLNISNNHFMNAGTAWRLYRQDKIDPTRFGKSGDVKISGYEPLFGAWFIRGQLLRDFAALNKIEAVPFLVRYEHGQDWKNWRLVSAKDADLSDNDLQLLDQVADYCVDPDDNLSKIKGLFKKNKGLYPLL